MKTPEHATPPQPRPSAQTGWRDLIQSNADFAAFEGFALEQLIDHQRGQSPRDGAGQ